MVDTPDANGWTPLHHAVKEGRLRDIQRLIQNGADVNKTTGQSSGPTATRFFSPLHIAVQEGQHEALKLLLAVNGIKVDKMKTANETPLYLAAEKGDIEAVNLLIAKNADVNKEARGGFTPLWAAASNGHAEVVKLLIDAGASVSVQTSTFVAPPLISAIHNDHVEVVRVLLTAGAPVDEASNGGVTPLMAATRNGNGDIIRMLATAGADVNLSGVEWQGRPGYVTPLICSIRHSKSPLLNCCWSLAPMPLSRAARRRR